MSGTRVALVLVQALTDASAATVCSREADRLFADEDEPSGWYLRSRNRFAESRISSSVGGHLPSYVAPASRVPATPRRPSFQSVSCDYVMPSLASILLMWPNQ